ncbi:MAG: DNA primase [Betaproteobacteria bacterium]
MIADRVTSTLQKVRRTGPGRWVACCPSHKDRTASLSVRELDNGTLLLHCFAGCSVDAVVAALGLRMEDLFPPRDSTPGAGRKPERKPFSVNELLSALSSELRVIWVLLADMEAGKQPGPRDRQRAGIARERCAALIEELRHVR